MAPADEDDSCGGDSMALMTGKPKTRGGTKLTLETQAKIKSLHTLSNATICNNRKNNKRRQQSRGQKVPDFLDRAASNNKDRSGIQRKGSYGTSKKRTNTTGAARGMFDNDILEPLPLDQDESLPLPVGKIDHPRDRSAWKKRQQASESFLEQYTKPPPAAASRKRRRNATNKEQPVHNNNNRDEQRHIVILDDEGDEKPSPAKIAAVVASVEGMRYDGADTEEADAATHTSPIIAGIQRGLTSITSKLFGGGRSGRRNRTKKRGNAIQAGSTFSPDGSPTAGPPSSFGLSKVKKPALPRDTRKGKENKDVFPEPPASSPLQQSPPRTRSSSQKRKKRLPKSAELIVIGSSDDEDESTVIGGPRAASSGSTTRQSCTPQHVPLERISIGTKVIIGAALEFDQFNFVLTFMLSGVQKQIKIGLDALELEEFTFYHDQDGLEGNAQFAFVAMKIPQDQVHGLEQFPNMYRANQKSVVKLVMQLESHQDCKALLKKLAQVPYLNSFVESSRVLGASDVRPYINALVQPNRRSRRNKLLVEKDERPEFLKGKGPTDLLLAYPFPLSVEECRKATEGLLELRHTDDEVLPEPMDCNEDSDAKMEDANTTAVVDKKCDGRAHYLEIRVEDFEKLDRTEWLNDSLIDFFMQWMVRNETSSICHVFTTHFYSTLEAKGPASVRTWTKKKDIDIFKLKVIFIPVHKSAHWSCCVVVNPGHIENGKNGPDDDPKPCILHFDSLKMHNAKTIRKNVMKWLNSEWHRLKGADGSEEECKQFTVQTFDLIRPNVTTQDNFHDCGVFVCRYTYAMYLLRNETFSYKQLERSKNGDVNIVRDAKAFQFEMEDIGRIRNEMKTLLERLSGLYLPWKEKVKKKKQEEKIAARAALSKNGHLSVEGDAGDLPTSQESSEAVEVVESTELNGCGMQGEAPSALNPPPAEEAAAPATPRRSSFASGISSLPDDEALTSTPKADWPYEFPFLGTKETPSDDLNSFDFQPGQYSALTSNLPRTRRGSDGSLRTQGDESDVASHADGASLNATDAMSKTDKDKTGQKEFLTVNV